MQGESIEAAFEEAEDKFNWPAVFFVNLVQGFSLHTTSLLKMEIGVASNASLYQSTIWNVDLFP